MELFVIKVVPTALLAMLLPATDPLAKLLLVIEFAARSEEVIVPA